MSNSDKTLQAKLNAARQVACFLDDLGHGFEAEQIRTVCRSAASLHSTAVLQRKDIDDLRARIADLPSREAEAA